MTAIHVHTPGYNDLQEHRFEGTSQPRANEMPDIVPGTVGNKSESNKAHDTHVDTDRVAILFAL